MKLIVGLGNPESKYDNTRHNVGFMVLDAFAKEKGYTFKTKKDLKGDLYVDKNFILLKPLTYMNLSGESVRPVADYYKIPYENIVIIVDDFNLPFMKVRLREKGSAGGHNGLKSIIAQLGTQEFKRIRIGLGSPEFNTIDYVLGKFTKDELKEFDKVYSKTNSIIQDYIDGKPFDFIMNRYNPDESI